MLVRYRACNMRARGGSPSLVCAARYAVCPCTVAYTRHYYFKSQHTEHMVEEYAQFHTVAATAAARGVGHHLLIEHVWFDIDQMRW